MSAPACEAVRAAGRSEVRSEVLRSASRRTPRARRTRSSSSIAVAGNRVGELSPKWSSTRPRTPSRLRERARSPRASSRRASPCRDGGGTAPPEPAARGSSPALPRDRSYQPRAAPFSVDGARPLTAGRDDEARRRICPRATSRRRSLRADTRAGRSMLPPERPPRETRSWHAGRARTMPVDRRVPAGSPRVEHDEVAGRRRVDAPRHSVQAAMDALRDGRPARPAL